MTIPKDLSSPVRALAGRVVLHGAADVVRRLAPEARTARRD
ncbi:hypothetical protein [Streptomyces virginiae]